MEKQLDTYQVDTAMKESQKQLRAASRRRSLLPLTRNPRLEAVTGLNNSLSGSPGDLECNLAQLLVVMRRIINHFSLSSIRMKSGRVLDSLITYPGRSSGFPQYARIAWQAARLFKADKQIGPRHGWRAEYKTQVCI